MKILCFTFGNARDPQTWSNVPFYLIQELENENYEVICIDVYQGELFKKISKLCNKAARLILGRDTLVLFETGPFLDSYYDYVVRKALKKHADAEKLLFFSYNMNGKRINHRAQSILFCDFTIEYVIRNIQKRKPTKLEERRIEHQHSIMQEADCIISLFPVASKLYTKQFGIEKVKKIPGHIINCDWKINNPNKLIIEKNKSQTVLFIGRKSYLKGAKILIDAVKKYNSKHTPIDLSIIGMTRQELGIALEPHISALGILNKNVAEEKKIFYREIEKAKFVINTTANWAGISSMVESMHLYTPVITSKYGEFLEIFGEKLEFGYYCESENVEALVAYLEKIFGLNEAEYSILCNKAHLAVKSFTWENCVKTIMMK